jgi:hypothetical protein
MVLQADFFLFFNLSICVLSSILPIYLFDGDIDASLGIFKAETNWTGTCIYSCWRIWYVFSDILGTIKDI